ncbi:MAG: hypothetical protein R2722_18640 [Tessaracoccus sp.]
MSNEACGFEVLNLKVRALPNVSRSVAAKALLHRQTGRVQRGRDHRPRVAGVPRGLHRVAQLLLRIRDPLSGRQDAPGVHSIAGRVHRRVELIRAGHVVLGAAPLQFQ